MHRFSLTTIAVTLLLATPVLAQSDQLGVPGPISFQDQAYALAWTARPTEYYFKQEYVPEGQSAETYREMILIEAVAGDITPMQAAALQVQSLEARKGNDPVFNYDIIQNEATGEVLLDFLISNLAANSVVVEWNAYRYGPLTEGEGVALFAVSRRGYGEEGARSFMGGLGAMRSAAIKALSAHDLPAIAIAP